MDKFDEKARAIDREMERRYGYFPGENPTRGWVRQTLETEPMAYWLARQEIAQELEK